MKNYRLSLPFLGLLLALSPLRAQEAAVQQETSEQKDKRMEWFSQAKLGIFIHWGIYAVKGVSESWSFFNNYLPYDESGGRIHCFPIRPEGMGGFDKGEWSEVHGYHDQAP